MNINLSKDNFNVKKVNSSSEEIYILYLNEGDSYKFF